MNIITSIIARVLRRVMCILHPGIKHALRCGCKSVYDAIEELWNAVIETIDVVNKNADEMEQFSAELKKWADTFQAKILALIQGGGTEDDPLGIIGWNSLTAELKDKLQKGLITGGRVEKDANGLLWLRLTTADPINSTISINISGIEGGGGSGEAPNFSALKFFEGIEDCYLGPDINTPSIILPYANGIEGGDDDLEARAGIMRKEQAVKLDNFYIEGDALHYDGKIFRLQPYRTEVGEPTYSGVAITRFTRQGSGNVPYDYTQPILSVVEYIQIKHVQYDDGSSANETINSGANITYRVLSGSGANISENGTIVFTKNTGSQRSVTFEAKVELNGSTETATLTITQNSAPSTSFVYYGSTDSYPTAETELNEKKSLPLTGNKMTILQNGKCQWVAVPAGYAVKSWVTADGSFPIVWNDSQQTITKDGVVYSIKYYSMPIPPSASTVEINKN